MTTNDDGEVREIYSEILARAPEHQPQPSLERVRHALDLLGDPQRAYQVVQITGTNGKTSTARMIEALVRESGLRTGRFTSPHLHTVRERIALDGDPISPERFVETYRDVEPYIAMADEKSQAEGGPRLSFFEVYTVMAYAAFADAPVDVAIVEVGMGGRWDSTNVADGVVEVIGRVERDHTRWLGHTLTEIASEKAGIISDNATVVVAEQHEEAGEIILSAAAQHGARLLRAGQELEVADRQIAVGGQLLTLRTPVAVYADIFLPLHGAHQAQNALLALAAAEALLGGRSLSGEVVEKAFASVSSPGRMEMVRNSPAILLDAAHNPAGAAALREAVEEAFAFDRLVGVVGIMRDKEAEAILAELEPVLDEVVVTEALDQRAMPADELAEIARDVFGEDRVYLAPRLDDAIDQAVGRAEVGTDIAGQAATGTGVLIAGSVLLAADARTLLGKKD
ncbi:bifunctional folylpolyglutamate synthase/dihydrofolate synthase [Bogoriella caseilytica]|uniref:Dihydrofolate synthase/folylpolyglutamate synthase n=1 Tax=Bogoriella caseilytica TaxID=56055 RepID=A0A3N2BFC4_9MICO|nr:Mur ligase family protein [Bogoriella caseilytica]ROR73958.1 dihydrofolate synthase/folylpolyglutamate synthase [Bogoriella caseilytica]